MIDHSTTGAGHVPEPPAGKKRGRKPYRRPSVKTTEAFESVAAGCCKGPIGASSS